MAENRDMGSSVFKWRLEVHLASREKTILNSCYFI
jgi:hypothetical protein